ncbi:receptor-type tyrosine-protein phosphatase beta-like [Branchiostoma floridae x Branchiostoma japonicum]
MGSSLEIPTVTGLCVTSYGTTSISISWTAVTGWWPLSDPEVRVHISASGPNETWKKSDDLLGGTSTKRFENLRPASNYTIRVAVLGWGGTEGKRTSILCATRPRPITSISVTEQTTSTIKVKWAAAIDNNVTYLAQITGHDPIPVDKDLAFVFKELDPGTSYDVSVIVKRTFEDGREVESRPCKTTASTCPARPEGFHVNSCSPYSITVAWQPPVGNIDCYKVDIWCKDQTKSRSDNQKPEQSQTKGKDSIECVFDSLSTNPGSLHRITISSHFQDLSSEMVEITQRTKVCSPDLKLCEKTETSITISWEHVKGEKEKYVLSLSPSEGESDVEIPCHENRLQHMFQNLVPGKEYKVSAITIYEDAECERCVLIVRTTVPPPQNITVIKESITAHSFMVRWDKVVGEISGYFVRYSSQSHCQYEPLPIAPEHQQAKLTDLIPGTTYSVSVCAKSGDDESTTDKVIQSTKVLPIIGSEVEVQTGPKHIQLSWKHPGGCVERYILCSSHSGELSIYPPRHTETYNNLVPGTKYIIELETESCGSRSGSPFHKEAITDPLPPEMVIFDRVGTDNAVVKWRNPEGKVNRYKLSIEPGGRKSVYVEWNNMPSYTFSSLDPGQRYELSMISEVLHGQTSLSTISTPKEEIFYTRPLPPVNLQITDISARSFQVSWDPPNKGTFENIRLGLSYGNNDPYYKSLPAGTKNHRFNELVSGRIYGVKICTKSGDQFSENETSAIQTDLIPPTISAPKKNPTSIVVHYELPESDCDKCVIALSSTNDSNVVKKLEIPEPQWQLDYMFEDLTPGEEYRILVTAHSRAIVKESQPLSVMTCLDTPKQIKIVTSFTSATVSWSHAQGHKDGYTVSVLQSEWQRVSQSKFVSKDDVLQTKFDNLVPGRKYKIKITTHLDHRGRKVKSVDSTKTFRTDIMKPAEIIVKEDGIGEKSIDFSWIDVEGDRDSYCSYVKHDEEIVDTRRKPAPQTRKSVLTQSFTSLVPGRKYTLIIQTISGTDKSEETSYTFCTKLAQPHVDKTLSSVDESSIRLFWKHSEGYWDDYEIEAESKETKERERIVWTSKESKEPEQMIPNLVPGSWYDISIRSVRGDQKSTPSTVRFRTLPNAPIDVEIATTGHEVTIEWKHPYGKNDGYVVKLSSVSETYEKNVLHNSSSCTFQELDAGRAYTVVLWAIISVDGREMSSKEVSRLAQTIIMKPAIEVLRKSETSIVLSWPDVEGDKTAYVLSINPEDVPQRTTCPKPKGKLHTEPSYQETFSTLYPGRLYTIHGVTESGDGNSEETILTVRTEVGEPKNPAVVNVKNQQVTITWEQAHGDQDKYTAAIFDTTLEDRAPQSIGDVSASASALEYRFSALVPGRKYEIAIRTNSGGETSEPETRLIRTLPLRPVNVRTSTVDTGIIVKWLEPSGDKDEYSLEICPNENLQSPVLISSGNETSHTFTGVTLGKLYDIKISTRSKDVDSAKVVRQQRMTVGPPNHVKPQPFETSLKVIWKHAEGVKDRYHIKIWEEGGSTYVREDVRNADEDLEMTFESLVSGRLYRVEVTTESGGEFSECVHETVRTKIRPPTEIIIADNDVKENSIRITWPEPYCDKDRYHVSITPKDGVENPVDVVERGQPLEYTFQKLTSGRKYQLSVWTDSGGDKSYPVTTMKRTTVSRIEEISIGERTENTLTITWRDAQGEKSSYIAFISEMNGEMPLQHFPNIRARSLSQPYSQTFTNLTPGRMYKVSVVTVSGEMESLPRNMPVRTIVSPPRNVKIPQDSVTEHSMDVVWGKAWGDWEAYDHIISPKEGSAKHIGQELLDGTMVYRSRFEELVAGKIYTIGVLTRNEGVGSEVVLLEGKRTKVAAVDKKSIVPNVSETEVTLKWAQAAGEKDRYAVTIRPSSDDAAATVKPPPAEINADDKLLHTFRDLTPGQKYTISIVTFKENDMSSEATKTIHTKPNKPEGFRVETFAESIAVSWDSPVGVQDEYMVEIRKVAEDPEWFIKATFAEKTGPPNDEGAGITDESTETRPWQSFKYTFREKGMIKARTKYKISAQTRSGEKQSGGQFSHVVSVEERTKPHPPRDPRLVKEGIESVTFSWAPPIDEEQKRDIYRYRYIVKYKGPGEEDEREHDCQYNNSAKIEHLRDNTEYDFFVISVVETTTEDGKQERVYSERCRFTFKTESRSTKIVRKFSKKMNQALFIVICGGAFVITLFTFLGVFIHNCVRPFDQNEVDSAIVIPSTNVTNTTNLNNISSVMPTSSSVQSYNSGSIECFFEKAGEQFWYFVFSTAVPAICLLAILLWKVVKRVRKSMTRATNGEIRRLLEESAIEMTDIYSDEDKPRLEYGITTTRQRWLFDSS